MKRAPLGLLVALAIAAGTAAPAPASWVSTNCFVDHHDVPSWTRGDARAYATVGAGEGYEWGGGCWNDNDRDDTPLDSDADSDGGEGPDCSGFTFKTWMLRPTLGANGGRWYNKLENIHGPYSTYTYRDPGANWPFFRVAKDKDVLIQMDAYVKSGHIGMIYTVQTSKSEDIIIEAWGKPSNPPTGIFARSYFADSDYVAIRRRGWTLDCSPRCTGAGRAAGAIVVMP